jgi:integrase
MQDDETSVPAASKRPPWNKGKLVGAKPPLRPKHVWSIRTKLQIADRKRDLAMFNLAIDSKLRGCDVVAVKVEDIAPHGYAVERATVRQKKTGLPVRFEVTEQTRQAVDDYIRAADRKPGDFLFAAPRRPGHGLSTRQYGRLVSDWIRTIVQQKPRSTIRSILSSVRPLSSDDGSSPIAWRWRSSCNRTARSHFCRHGCWTNRLHVTLYANPQHSRSHCCSHCALKSMRF